MNRRSFLKFCGIAPVVPTLVGELLAKPTQINTVGSVYSDGKHLESRIHPHRMSCWGQPREMSMWNNDQSDPIADIIRAMKTIKSHTGSLPQTYVISKENYERLDK